MKDTLIKATRKKRELWIALVCFLFAFLMNVYSIIRFKTEWSELLTTLHITILLAIFIYILVGIVRLIVWWIMLLFGKKKKIA